MKLYIINKILSQIYIFNLIYICEYVNIQKLYDITIIKFYYIITDFNGRKSTVLELINRLDTENYYCTRHFANIFKER